MAVVFPREGREVRDLGSSGQRRIMDGCPMPMRMTREGVLQADAKMAASVDTHCSPMASVTH
jgi:hypothetical protein